MWSDKFVQYLTWKISGMHFCLEQKTIDTFAWYHPLNFSHGCVVWHWYTPAAPLTNAPATKWRISVKWQELNRPGTFIVPPFSFITIKCKHESLFYHLRSIFLFCFVFFQESMRLRSEDSCRIYYTMSYLHKSNTQKMFTPQKSFIHLFDEIIISKYFLSTCLLWYIIGSTLLPFGNVFDPVFHRQTMVLFAGEAMSAHVMSLIPIVTKETAKTSIQD